MPRVFLSGASSGIGLATAKLLALEGFEVWGSSRDRLRLPSLTGFHPVEMDLCEPSSISAAFTSALAEAGAFEVLINNAGDGVFGPYEHVPLDTARRQFETLVFGHIDLIQRVLPLMRERGFGIIINVSSIAARLPIPFMASYNAAKAALSAYSASLNIELAGTGVKVVDLQPGDISTGFNAAMRRMETAGSYAIALERAWRRIESDMAAAPPAELVARAILRLIAKPIPRAVVGGFVQSQLAPLAARLLPLRALLRAIRGYYGIARQ